MVKRRQTGSSWLKQRRSKRRAKAGTKRIAMVAKKVMMRSAETKRSLTTWDESVQTTNTLSATEMTVIAQGDEINNRTGRQILASGISVKGAIHNNNTLEPVIVKMMVLQAKPGVTDTITSTTAMFCKARHDTAVPFNAIGGLNAMLYDVDPERFTILGQKRFILESSTDPNTTEDQAPHGGKGTLRFFNKYIALKGKKINYDNSTASSCQNKIHVVWMCVQPDNDQVVGTSIERTAIASLTFKDF
jgi:hypothetical protein